MKVLSLSAMGAAIATALTIAAVGCGDDSVGAGGSSSASTAASPVTATTNATGTGPTSSHASSGTSTGASTGAGDPSCATTGHDFLLCDDFEGQAVGDGPDDSVWTVSKSDGATVLIDDAEKKFGAHALHLHMDPDNRQATLKETKTFPLPGGTNSFYGRAFFMLGAGINMPTHHTNFFEGDGPVPGGGNGNYRYGSSNGKFLANYNPGDPAKGSDTEVPKGTWACMEWAFLGDTNELHFYLDGNELTDIAIPPEGLNGNVWTAPMFNSAYFGWITYENDTASDHYDVWYDNVAIDTQRIGCDK